MSLLETLKSFDQLTYKQFDEHDVSTALRTLLSEERENIDDHLKAEVMAFDFAEDYKNDEVGWGTYFGPMMVWNNGDGTSTESPSISLITPAMIDYWQKRATESVNPILKARYAGLVWDFKKKITGVAPEHELANLYIKALIEIAKGDFHKYPTSGFVKLERALNLAASFNIDDLINEAKEAIIGYEEKHSIDNKPGLWGYAYDLLFDNKKVKFNRGEKEAIIDELEAKLKRLVPEGNASDQKTEPWAAEAAAKRLAEYYMKQGKAEDVKRVILEIGRAYDMASSGATAMQMSGWLDQVHKIYVKFGLKDDAEKLLLRIRELGPKAASELQPIEHSFELEPEMMKAFLAEITAGEIQEFLKRVAIHFIPDKEREKENMLEISRQSPLLALIGHQIQDEKGRVIASVGSLKTDLEGHIVRHISNSLNYAFYFLRATIQECIDNKSLDQTQIIKFIENCPVIGADRFIIIENGLAAYFSGDLLVAIHLLVPQIEEAIRNAVELCGGNVLKPARSGGYHLRTFDELLRDEILKSALGEGFTEYLRILFTDQRGWNIRNNVCHGIAPPHAFDYPTADRVLHALLCLGLIYKSS